LADEYLSEAFIKSLHAQVVSMKDDIASTAAGTRENTEAIKRIAEDTRGIVEMFSALEGGFKVLSGIGRLAKPIFYIASATGAILGVWAAIKAGFMK
jgi:hypothetical protein